MAVDLEVRLCEEEGGGVSACREILALLSAGWILVLRWRGPLLRRMGRGSGFGAVWGLLRLSRLLEWCAPLPLLG